MLRVRYGRVAGRGTERHTVRVTFAEVEETQSFDLPVLVARPGDFCLPVNDSLVACLIDDDRSGEGLMLGCIYSEADAPPLDDADKRGIKGPVALGEPGATKPAAYGDVTYENFRAIQQHLAAFETVITGPAINEPGNGAPSLFQQALSVAISSTPNPTPDDVRAEKVTIK